MKLLLLAALAAVFTVTNAETYTQTSHYPINPWYGVEHCDTTEYKAGWQYRGIYPGNHTISYGTECCIMQWYNYKETDNKWETIETFTYKCEGEDGNPKCTNEVCVEDGLTGGAIALSGVAFIIFAVIMCSVETDDYFNDPCTKGSILCGSLLTLLSLTLVIIFLTGNGIGDNKPGDFGLHVAATIVLSINVVIVLAAFLNFFLHRKKQQRSNVPVPPKNNSYRKVRFNIA